MPSVDIVIPCYEHGRFLAECVASVTSQRPTALRILIVDNASRDDSLAVARRLSAADPRIEVLARTENLGPHASFNAGVDWASGDYLMVLCSDDLLSAGALEAMLDVMERHPDCAFCYGDDVHHSGDGAPPVAAMPDDPPWRLVSGEAFIRERCRRPASYIAAGMVLARTIAHKRAGHYRPALPHTDDFEMLLRLACLGSVAHTPAVVGVKRIHGTNRTHDFLAERTRDLVERVAALDSFFSHEGATLSDAGTLARLGRRSVAERAYWCGLKDLVRGRGSAVGLLRLAVRLDPRVAVLPPLGYLRRLDRSLGESVRG